MEKFLPISVRDFEQMITGNFVYVDKSRYVYEMARIPQAYYFLARPRRFGKSLLASTLKALFEGRKDLFKGLWVETSGWDWKPYPVLEVDFSEVDATDTATLQESLSIALDRAADVHGLQLRHRLVSDKFVELILAANKACDAKVVVLIDEYDKPIISHLGKGEEALQIAKQNRDLLKTFFGILKGAHVSAALRFVFITGVSKFSRVSIFSELNNLQDLTMHAAYAGLLGYTQEELEQNFGDWIQNFACSAGKSREEILRDLREWYNGYRFTETDLPVYNPFSIINALSEFKLKNFWFDTATPSFLVNLIKEKNYPIPNIDNMEVSESAFSTYELENLRLEALLLQTGYVTIRDYDGVLYRLGYPNQEVKTAFSNHLYDSMVDIADTVLKAQFKRLHQYLTQEDLAQFIETANAILSAIPYPHIGEQDERYYHTVFYLMVAASGTMVQTELLSSRGRMDLAVEFKDKVYVIELKCNQPAVDAIVQIREKGYHEKYLQSGRKIFLLGINFDTTKRAIAEWRVEKI